MTLQQRKLVSGMIAKEYRRWRQKKGEPTPAQRRQIVRIGHELARRKDPRIPPYDNPLTHSEKERLSDMRKQELEFYKKAPARSWYEGWHGGKIRGYDDVFGAFGSNPLDLGTALVSGAAAGTAAALVNRAARNPEEIYYGRPLVTAIVSDPHAFRPGWGRIRLVARKRRDGKIGWFEATTGKDTGVSGTTLEKAVTNARIAWADWNFRLENPLLQTVMGANPHGHLLSGRSNPNKEEFTPGWQKPTVWDVEVEVWEERDRLHIAIRDKRNEKIIADWWDEDAQQMFEDGFFESGRGLESSVVKYAEDVGILRKRLGNPLTRRESAEILMSSRSGLRAAQEPWRYPEERKFLRGRAHGQAQVVDLYGPRAAGRVARKMMYRAIGHPNPRRSPCPPFCDNPKHGHKRTQKNPPSNRRKVTMPLAKFAAMLQKRGDPEMIRAFQKKIEGYKKWTHGSMPKTVTLETANVPGVTGLWITYDAGREPEALYAMPGNSKRKGAWRHEWGTMPRIKHDPEAGIVLKKLSGSSKISDFYHR